MRLMRAGQFKLRLKLILIFSFALAISNSWGAPKPPNNCLDSQYQYIDEQLLLSPLVTEPIQRLYLVKNTSPDTVILTHTNEDYLVSLGWRSKIDKDRWSAFGVDTSDFLIDCKRQDGETILPIACEAVLAVCYIPDTRFALSSLGSFWVSENKPLNQALVEVRRKGVKLLRPKKRG